MAPRAHTHTRTHPPSRISPAVLTYCLRARERVCAAAARWLSKDRQPGLVEDRPLLRAQKVRLPQEVTAAGAGARTASAPPLEVERGQRRVGTERKKRSPCQPTKDREARVHGFRTPDLRVPQTAPSTINRRTIQRSCDHGVHRCDHTGRDENKSVCWPCRKRGCAAFPGRVARDARARVFFGVADRIRLVVHALHMYWRVEGFYRVFIYRGTKGECLAFPCPRAATVVTGFRPSRSDRIFSASAEGRSHSVP